jgi:ribonucleoside-diphosphate reductase beta chain
MDMISSRENKFLRKKVAEYQKSGVMNTDGEAQKISFDADFLKKQGGAKSERKLDI